MAAFPATFLIALLAAASLNGASAAETATAANPIRKVVTMLQAMEKKVTAEGETEKDLFEKFMCYCKNSDGALAASIADAEAKVPSVTADIEEAEQQVATLKADLKQAQTDRAAAKATMADATTLREKDAGLFATEKAEADANIAAVGKATAAIEKGMSGSFFADGQRAGVEELGALAERHERHGPRGSHRLPLRQLRLRARLRPDHRHPQADVGYHDQRAQRGHRRRERGHQDL